MWLHQNHQGPLLEMQVPKPHSQRFEFMSSPVAQSSPCPFEENELEKIYLSFLINLLQLFLRKSCMWNDAAGSRLSHDFHPPVQSSSRCFFFGGGSIWRISSLLNLLLVQLKYPVPWMLYSLALNPKQNVYSCMKPYSSILHFVKACAQPLRLHMPLIHCDTLLLQCLYELQGKLHFKL